MTPCPTCGLSAQHWPGCPEHPSARRLAVRRRREREQQFRVIATVIAGLLLLLFLSILAHLAGL